MIEQEEVLHAALQEILDYTVDVCKKYNLTYCLAYGTALGAYRHKGFIPWDDDLDIVMPRDDYQRFIQIMKRKPSDTYVIQNEDTENGYYLPFLKVRKHGTLFIESISECEYRENGIYIDVFPLDYVDEINTIKMKIDHFRVSYWRHALKLVSCKNLYRNKLGRLRFAVELCLCVPVSILGIRASVKRMHKIMQGNGNPESEYVAQYDQAMEKAILKKSIYFPVQEMEFEGKQYCVPNDICQYLETQYGSNYMELPPIEERATHKPVQLEC